jgi:hypothetical protein
MRLHAEEVVCVRSNRMAMAKIAAAYMEEVVVCVHAMFMQPCVHV